MFASTGGLDHTLWDWEELRTKKKHPWTRLLIGNGASMAVSTKFGYPTLFAEACRTGAEAQLSASDAALFASLGTKNFEYVLHGLIIAERMSSALGLDSSAYRDAYDRIRKSLFYAIHRIHIQQSIVPDRILSEIGEPLLMYDVVFTTNYDLLTYWSLMAQTTGKKSVDYFWKDGNSFDLNDTEIRDGRNTCTRIFYLHGALHLYHMVDGKSKKLTWTPGASIIDQLYNLQPRDHVPLFVSEGSATEKMASILRSEYLSFAYREFSNYPGSLVVFGHSLEQSDQHLVDAISKHSGRPVAISVYAQDEEEVVRIKSSYYRAFGRRLNLYFFDSRTHPLGDPSLHIAR